MWNNWYDGSRYNNNYREFASKSIRELIQNGIAESRAVSTEEYGADPQKMFYLSSRVDRWMDYSQKMVELSTKNLDTTIHLNYLRLLLSMQNNRNVSLSQKINTCLDYLIEVLRILATQYY